MGLGLRPEGSPTEQPFPCSRPPTTSPRTPLEHRLFFAHPLLRRPTPERAPKYQPPIASDGAQTDPRPSPPPYIILSSTAPVPTADLSLVHPLDRFPNLE